MFELKLLHTDAIPSALEKANRYRLLNEPSAAESICLDILEIEAENQEALITLVLAISDRFGKDYAVSDNRIQDFVSRIKDEYQRTYYTGIVYERRAKALLNSGSTGYQSNIFEYFRQAMNAFEKAEEIGPRGNDEAILRWNGCARIVMHNKLEPREMDLDFLE